MIQGGGAPCAASNRARKPGGVRTARDALAELARVAIALMCVAQLVSICLGWQVATWAGCLAVVVFALGIAPRLGRFGLGAVALALGLGVACVLRAPQPAMVLIEALDRSSYLASFVVLVGSLQLAAAKSASVASCGAYLAHQPAGRRFVSMYAATQFIGAILLFGVISLLVPLIQQGARAGGQDSQVAALAERRQLVALHRGFAWLLLWAPTTVFQALVHRMFDDLDDTRLFLTGVAMSLGVLAISWFEDRVRWRSPPHPVDRVDSPAPEGPRFDRPAWIRLSLICGALLCATVSVAAALEASLVDGLIVTVPFIVLLWFALQARRADRGAAFAAGLRERIRSLTALGSPHYAQTAFTMAIAGFIGTVCAALLTPWLIENQGMIARLHPFAILMGLSLSVVIVSLLAVSPLVLMVLIGSIVTYLPVLPVGSTDIAIALLLGWAIGITASPYAVGALLVARAARRSPLELWKWNRAFTAVVAGLATAYLFVAALAA